MWPFKKKVNLLIFTAPGAISELSAKRIEDMAKQQFPDAKILVLGDSLAVEQKTVVV